MTRISSRSGSKNETPLPLRLNPWPNGRDRRERAHRAASAGYDGHAAMNMNLDVRPMTSADRWPLRWWNLYRRYLWYRFRLTSHVARKGQIVQAHGVVWIWDHPANQP